jgi:hypothetical protein
MNIEISAHFHPSHIEKALEQINSLPMELRPSRFATSEKDTTGLGSLENKAKYSAFKSKNGAGYFLLSSRARYEINLKANRFGYSTIEVDSIGQGITPIEAKEIITCLANAEPHFAYAYKHRNKYARKLEGTTFEAWIGRDLRKYLPGLYWMTLIPKQTGASIEINRPTLTTSIDYLASGCIVTAFKSPDEWKHYADGIDIWLSSTLAFFSRNKTVERLDAAQTASELRELLIE